MFHVPFYERTNLYSQFKFQRDENFLCCTRGSVFCINGCFLQIVTKRHALQQQQTQKE